MLLFESYQNLLSLIGSIPFPLLFAAIGVLGLGFLLGDFFLRIWRQGLQTWLASQVGDDFSQPEIAAVFHGFQKRYLRNKQQAAISLTDFFVRAVFSKSHQGHHRYLLIGSDGVGKTTFLLRLFLKYRLRLGGRAYRLRVLSLRRTDVLEQLAAVERPEKTILLLDGLEEDWAAHKNYRKRLDAILQGSERFARVILSCREGFLPDELMGGPEATEVHYIGEECYQVFGKIHLAPFAGMAARNLLRNTSKDLSRKESRRLLRQFQQQPELMGRPAYAQWFATLHDPRETKQLPFQIVAAKVYRSLGKHTDVSDHLSRLFSFYADLSWQAYESYQWGNGSLIAGELLGKVAASHQVPMEWVHQGALILPAGNSWRFQHSSFWAFFLAWRAFHQQLPAEETRFDDQVAARQFYQEMCWDALIQSPLAGQAECRTANMGEKRPLHAVHFDELAKITRLYFSESPFGDFRFLRNLSHLKGIHIEMEQESSPPANLVAQLPSQQVLMYVHLPEQEYPVQVWELAAEAAELRIDGEQAPMLLSAQVLRKLVLEDRMDPRQACRRPQSVRKPSKALVQLFETPIMQLEKESGQPLPLSEDEPLTETFELILGGGEMDLFDRIQVFDFDDQSRNLLCYNRYQPTLLNHHLENALAQLVEVLGEDDNHQEGFESDDLAQIEDGHWTGRTWSWKNTDAYAYGAHLYMEEPGTVKLCIFGLEHTYAQRQVA